MDVSLIQVPYMLGDPHHGAAKGPHRYLEGGAEGLLTARGHRVTVELVEPAEPGPFSSEPSASRSAGALVHPRGALA